MDASTIDTYQNEATTEGAAAAYWQTLIPEEPAADFLSLKKGTLQNYRQFGDGPKYIRLSARCIRYTRADLREWAESRKRTSTSDLGEAA